MKLTLIIPDNVYAEIVGSSRWQRGSIQLLNAQEGVFHAHKNCNRRSRRQYIRTAHGRTSIGANDVRMTINMKLDENGLDPYSALMAEAEAGAEFVSHVCDI